MHEKKGFKVETKNRAFLPLLAALDRGVKTG